jgi:hypothetical protein
MKIVPEYSIQKADFEKQKKELKAFAEQPATSTELDKFSTDGQWSDFWSGGLVGVLSGHKVTGEEINSLVTKLQSCFAEINERDRKVIKEFGQVYETFEALDKGYIQGILIGVKSAERASQEAKDAQKDINDTIKALQITINKLKEFKGEINRYAHIKDIDDIWCDIQRFQIELESISTELKTQGANLDKKISILEQLKIRIEKTRHFNDIDSMWSTIKSQREEIGGFSRKLEELSGQLTEKINDMLAFKEEIERAEHINDIDSIWENTKNLQEEISRLSDNLEKRIEKVETEISKIVEITKGQSHFGDIDNIWEGLQEVQKAVGFHSESVSRYEEAQERIDKELSDVNDFISGIQRIEHFYDIDAEWEFSHGLIKNIEATDNKVLTVERNIQEYGERLQKTEDENAQLKSKINTAYIVAGGAILLSVVQLILQLAGIL